MWFNFGTVYMVINHEVILSFDLLNKITNCNKLYIISCYTYVLFEFLDSLKICHGKNLDNNTIYILTPYINLIYIC